MDPTPTNPSRCSDPPASPKGTARFRKADRLRRRADFLKAQAQGRRLHTHHFGIILAPAPAGAPRLGLAVSRRLGKAVQRNRVRRLLREFFRRHKSQLPPRDLVIMAKKGAAELNYLQVAAELGRLLLRKEQDAPKGCRALG